MFYMNEENIYGVDYLFIQFLPTQEWRERASKRANEREILRCKKISESCYRFNLYRKYVR